MQASRAALIKELERLRISITQATQQALIEDRKAKILVIQKQQLELQVEAETKKLSDIRMAKHRPELEMKAMLTAANEEVRGPICKVMLEPCYFLTRLA
jgi:hypothetical protein